LDGTLVLKGDPVHEMLLGLTKLEGS
jgi:hypothetical protein